MKYYRVISFDGDKDHEEILSEKDILDQYWDHWSRGMWAQYRDPMEITEDACIQDFCIVHWAEEVKDNAHILKGLLED